MVLYNLMVVHWSIFTLFTQLIFCASVYTNSDPKAVRSESICSQEPEKFIDDKGVESSLTLELYPDETKNSCKRQFRAPEAYSFYVRLQKTHKTVSKKSSSNNKKYSSKKSTNSTGSCQLSISHSLNGELLPPWRLDPCELEANGIHDEPVRLLQGRLSIVWNHYGNRPAYRLSITVIGNGMPHCLQKDKHTCLELDEVPLLCISKELTCDGVPHCPAHFGGYSDEDIKICQTDSKEEDPAENGFAPFSFFKTFFMVETTPPFPKPNNLVTSMEEEKLDELEIEDETKLDKKGPKGSLTGLSKYGPWGYLFLGMLLCGGALLVCGLWECCCKHHKPDPIDTLSNGEVPNVLIESSISASTFNGSNITQQTLPQYDELDPPPPYSALFPALKLSSENLNSFENRNLVDSSQSSSGASSIIQNINSAQTQTD